MLLMISLINISWLTSYILVLSTVLKDRWSGHNGRDELAFLLGPNNYVVVIVGLFSYHYHMRSIFIMCGVI